MRGLVEAVEEAARAAAGGMTMGLRRHAAYLGWDPDVARSLTVRYLDGAFVAESAMDAALDAEYGDASGSSPRPAIRTFDSKGMATAHLREALDGMRVL